MRKTRSILSILWVILLAGRHGIAQPRRIDREMLREIHQLIQPKLGFGEDEASRTALPVFRQLDYDYYRYENNGWVLNGRLKRTYASTAHPATEVLINAANPLDTIQSSRYSFDAQQRPVALVYKSSLADSYNEAYAYNADGSLAKNITVQRNNINTLDTVGITDARYRFDTHGRMIVRTARYLYQYNYAFPDTVRNETREDWRDSIAYRSNGTYPLELFHFTRPVRRGGSYRLQKHVILDMADSVHLVPRALHTMEYDVSGGDSLDIDLTYHNNGPNAWNGEEKTLRYGVLSSTRRSHLRIDPRMFVHRDRLPVSFAQTPVAALAYPEADSWVLIDDRTFQPNGTMLQYSVSDSVGVRSDGIPTVRVRRIGESLTDTNANFLPEVKIVLTDIQAAIPARTAHQTIRVSETAEGSLAVYGLPKGTWTAYFTDASGRRQTHAEPVTEGIITRPALLSGVYVLEFQSTSGERRRTRVFLH